MPFRPIQTATTTKSAGFRVLKPATAPEGGGAGKGTETAPEGKKQGFLSKVGDFLFHPTKSPIQQFGTGAAKGALTTLHNIGKLETKIPIVGPMLKKAAGYAPDEEIETPEILKPEGTAQKIGFGTEQVGEFLIPVGAGAKAVTKGGLVLAKGAKFLGAGEKGVKIATTLGKVATEAGISGAEFAGKTFLQTGGDTEETKRAGIIGAATPPILRGAGAAIKAASKPVGDVLSSVIATMIGKSPEHIKIAFQNPVQVAEKMAQKKIPEEVRSEAVAALSKYRSDYGTAFEKGLQQIKKTYPFGKTGKILVKREMDDATEGIPAIFRKFRVAVTDGGKTLDFDKLNSAIVKGGEQKNLQKVFDTIRDQKSFSVQGVQDVAARINALSKFEEGAKTQTSAVITGIHDAYAKAIEKVYPELGKLRNEYRASSEIYQGIDDVIKSVKKEISDPTAVTNAIRKLSNLFKEDNEAYLRAIQRLEKVSGVDLINSLVASEFRNIAPASFGSRAAQAGILSGAAISSNPLLLLVLPLFSPRVEGKIITGAGKLLPKAGEVVSDVAPLIPRAATPLTRPQ